MSIASIVTRGFGGFGSVNRLPTLGYGQSTPQIVITDTHDGGKRHDEHYKRRKHGLHMGVERLFEEIVEGKVFAPQAEDIVQPFGGEHGVDWQEVAAHVQAVELLRELAAKAKAFAEDDSDLRDLDEMY